MHYCQSCDGPEPMVPDGNTAVCPRCGRIDRPAQRRPMIVVVGASASGKTAIHESLAAELAGTAVVFDADRLVGPFARHPGVDGIDGVDWPSWRDAWLHVAHGVAQSGLATVLLSSFIPETIDDLPGRRWIGAMHYVVLDCPDDERRRRLEARTTWRARDIEEQIDFARWLRTNLAPVVDTSIGSPTDTAAVVARHIRSLLAT